MKRARIVVGILAALLTVYTITCAVGLTKGFDLMSAILCVTTATFAWLGWWFVFGGWRTVQARLKWALIGGIVLGGLGFIVGFFGPLIWAPHANQGPLLGIFVTGPLGFVVGAVLGALFGRERRPHEGPQALPK